jgi:hypothetical protein
VKTSIKRSPNNILNFFLYFFRIDKWIKTSVVVDEETSVERSLKWILAFFLYFFIVNNWVGTSIVVIKEAIVERGQVMVRRRTASGSRWRREGQGENREDRCN